MISIIVALTNYLRPCSLNMCWKVCRLPATFRSYKSCLNSVDWYEITFEFKNWLLTLLFLNETCWYRGCIIPYIIIPNLYFLFIQKGLISLKDVSFCFNLNWGKKLSLPTLKKKIWHLLCSQARGCGLVWHKDPIRKTFWLHFLVNLLEKIFKYNPF